MQKYSRNQIKPTKSQERLLYVLLESAPEPIMGKTFIQKIAFLMQKEVDEDYYKFESMDYGPYSKELQDTIDYMIENGIIDRNESIYKNNNKTMYEYNLNKKVENLENGEEYEKLQESASFVFQEYTFDSLTDLIKEMYSKYPSLR